MSFGETRNALESLSGRVSPIWMEIAVDVERRAKGEGELLRVRFDGRRVRRASKEKTR